jgi:hypothetical protein
VTIAMLSLLVFLAPLVIGLVLIIVSKRGRLGYAACGGCGYDLSGNIGETDRCPECGAHFKEVGITPPRRSNRPVALGAGIALTAVGASCLLGMVVTAFLAHTSTRPAPPPRPTVVASPSGAPAPTASVATEPSPPSASPTGEAADVTPPR